MTLWGKRAGSGRVPLSVTSTSFTRLFIFLPVWAGRGLRGERAQAAREPPSITAGDGPGANAPAAGGAEPGSRRGEQAARRSLGDTPVSGCAGCRAEEARPKRPHAGRGAGVRPRPRARAGHCHVVPGLSAARVPREQRRVGTRARSLTPGEAAAAPGAASPGGKVASRQVWQTGALAGGRGVQALKGRGVGSQSGRRPGGGLSPVSRPAKLRKGSHSSAASPSAPGNSSASRRRRDPPDEPPQKPYGFCC